MNAEPLFILTTPRSFSSLTCAMLGQHPQMYSLLETRVFEVDSMREWWGRYGEANHDGDGLFRSIAEVVYGAQNRWTVCSAKRWVVERLDARDGSDVLRELAEHLMPLGTIEKTPIEGMSEEEILPTLRRRFARFPRARYLHLVRHPMGYCRSQLEHLTAMASGSPNPGGMARRYAWICDPTTDPPTLDPQVLWHRVHRVILEFLSRIPVRQWHQVRAEELVAEPEKHLLELAEWLGIRADSRALEEMKHPERSPFACLGPSNARWGADPKFFRDPRLRSRVLSGEPQLHGSLPWRNDRKGFSSQVCGLAKQFGYN